MRLVALDQFYYSGKLLKAGDEFDASEFDAMVLTKSKHPRAKQSDCAAPVDEAPAQPQPERRRYRRRDLRAEN